MPYSGRATTTGNSQGMAFEKALFRAFPAFGSGRLEAEPISENYLLVKAIPDNELAGPSEDPVVGAFLEFMETEMRRHPEGIRALTSLDRAEQLVAGMSVDRDEDLGEEDLL